MKPSNAREAALFLLLRIELGGAYLDRILSSPGFRNLDRRNRGFVREIISGVERWKLRLDRIIDRYYHHPAKPLSPEIRNILRIGLYQLMFMDLVPARAAVDESVKLADKAQGKGAGGLVNALLRRFTREGEPADWPADPAERLSTRYSYPLWIARRWISHFSEEAAESIMRAGNEKHPAFIRVNLLKTDSEKLCGLLVARGCRASTIGELPGFLSLASAEGLFETNEFQRGLFTVQDPSAAIAAFLLDPKPGETVLDLCAAPGGKATHLAELMGGAGRVTAVDIHPQRLQLVCESASRLDFSMIDAREGDACTFDSGELYDGVLIDVPCMGTAVFSKRPDMKWSRNESDIPRLNIIQSNMLEHASTLVKPGGRIVYSTCSLEPEENSERIADFLKRHNDFALDWNPRYEEYKTGYGYLIHPHRMHGAGAFASRIKRVCHVEAA